ncbi:uncharacterized protein LOC113762837 isoform X1 [Coffea eugenioides]|uniref:uncharacterized protein LOC113762837 isoform X1 n=1 Tax=Coffea eugenioides TaxID=49369 RepID=UPI000F60833F|nr:uncharacterized protein LOC113762837 isoform X1 [Coffea eugenioides]
MAEEEAKLSADSIRCNDIEMEDRDEGENEKFYEDIEAPKFVDFTVPDHYRPDDRYWFCLRVGCDQKHEEEMDSEAIYKNFVLRVMAARSPNVRFHKALNRNCSSRNMKCPLSAPPKSSKSRMSRLAIISSMSKKIGADKEKAKVSCTPKTKGKQVAAKYLTTPRNKNCMQNQNAFRSVQNPKPPSVAVPKCRVVAKALIFHSPKTAISMKKSVELRTPLTKLCEGMKKLEVSSQRKPVLGCSSKQPKQLGHNSQKSLPQHSSTRQKGSNKEKCRAKISHKLNTTQINHDPKSLRSLNSKSKDKLSKQFNTKISSARVTKAKSRDDNRKRPVKEAACPISHEPLSTELESCAALSHELNHSPNLALANEGGKYLPKLQASCKENDAIQENVRENDSSTEVSSRNGENLNNVLSQQDNSLCSRRQIEMSLGDDKENASALDDKRNYDKKDQSGRKILGTQNSDGKKVIEAIDKDLKGPIVGAPGMKLKLKPTHPKPFRLRTDERGILREANLERKNQAITPQNEAAVVSRFQGGDLQGQHVDIQNEIASLKRTNRQVRTKTPTGPSRVKRSEQQELKPESSTSQASDYDLKKTKSSSRRVLQPQRHFSVTTEARTPDKLLSVIMETSSGKSKPKEVEKPCKKGTIPTVVRPRAPACPGSLSRGRRPVTIPREPNFHRSHMPTSHAAKVS